MTNTLSGWALLGVLALALLLVLPGCAHVVIVKTGADGSRTAFTATSFLSNTALKGLIVDGTTKTTTNLLRITGGATEPNPEAINASADALGTLVGTALKTAK